MRSLYSGISGLRNHQTRMDVIGNNIANVNTAGYKTSRVIFQDIFSQNVAAGMANQGEIGGTNPKQIGLGIRLSTVDVIHSRAAFQRTDRETDMMINGDGFFIVAQMNDAGQFEPFYTRAGNFDIDNDGYLVTSSGLYVLGRNVELIMGVIDPGAEAVAGRVGSNRVPTGGIAPVGTWIQEGYFEPGDIVPVGLLQRAAVGPPAVDAMPPADPGDPDAPVELTAGQAQDLNDFISDPDNGVVIDADGTRAVRTLRAWTTAGDLVGAPREILRVESVTASPARDPAFGLIPGGVHPDSDINGLSRIRMTALRSTVPVFSELPEALQNELLAAMAIDDPLLQREALDAFFMNFDTEEVGLPGFAVAENGDVSVILGNRKVVIGRIAIAMFSNPPGLEKGGNSLYRESASSGPVVLTEAFQDGAGKIDGGGLEMSNVDLANEFTDMIVTQRGFQANSRIITVSDTMLEELVNLKR